MRQLPCARDIFFLGRRNVHHVMKPAIPAFRGHGSLAFPGVNDPAALPPQRGIDLPRAIITVAIFILADEFAEEQCVQRRIQGLTMPPGENPIEPFHGVGLPLAWRERSSPCPDTYERAGACCL